MLTGTSRFLAVRTHVRQSLTCSAVPGRAWDRESPAGPQAEDNLTMKINLKKFEKNLVVRPLRSADWEGVVKLQERCFPGMDPWTKEQFESQLRIFADGQIGVEYQGKLVASSSSLILDFELYKDWHDFDEISDRGFIRNHDPDGTTLYGIEMMVHPNFRGLKLARRLYDARKKLARERNLMRIVVGGRIPGYAGHADQMSAREYIERVMNKELQDPVLTTQVSNGFVLKRLIAGYLKVDADSRGFAKVSGMGQSRLCPRSAPSCHADRTRCAVLV